MYKHYSKLALIAAAALSLAAASSCGSQDMSLLMDEPQQQTPKPPATDSLGAPRDLLSQTGGRSASAVPYELTQLGNEYVDALPNNQVAENILALDLGAQGASEQNPLLSDCAYAIYNFNAPQYSGDLIVQAAFNFGMEPQQGKFYVGVANWNSNRWDWNLLQNDRAAFGDSAPYKLDGVGDGTVLVAIMLDGGAAQLSRLSLGETVAPRAVIGHNQDSPTALTGASVTFFAALFGGGTATLFEWDWDGDGIYDFSDTFDAAQHAFGAAGEYEVGLRITVEGGASDTETLLFTVSDPMI